MMTLRLVPALALWPIMAPGLTLDFPGNAALVSEVVTPAASYDLPIAAWVDGTLPVEQTEGEVTKQVWQVSAAGITTLQLMTPLRTQLTAQGFDLVLDCDTRVCGGFDFRFATDVAPPPDMFVDLGDFRFLSARKSGSDDPEVVSLLVSRTNAQGFVQVIRAGVSTGAQTLGTPDAPALRPVTTTPAVSGGPDAPVDFATRLDQDGHVVLTDLAFDSGSAQLGPGPFESLQDLADYLVAHPRRTVALVGHTDASGGLEGNIALSKRRAGSVLERLVSEFATPRAQLDAQGMGYLAPISTNLTAEGRDANRRVEVIVTSTE